MLCGKPNDSQVYEAVNTSNGQIIAIKQIELKAQKSHEAVRLDILLCLPFTL